MLCITFLHVVSGIPRRMNFQCLSQHVSKNGKPHPEASFQDSLILRSQNLQEDFFSINPLSLPGQPCQCAGGHKPSGMRGTSCRQISRVFPGFRDVAWNFLSRMYSCCVGRQCLLGPHLFIPCGVVADEPGMLPARKLAKRFFRLSTLFHCLALNEQAAATTVAAAAESEAWICLVLFVGKSARPESPFQEYPGQEQRRDHRPDRP